MFHVFGVLPPGFPRNRAYPGGKLGTFPSTRGDLEIFPSPIVYIVEVYFHMFRICRHIFHISYSFIFSSYFIFSTIFLHISHISFHSFTNSFIISHIFLHSSYSFIFPTYCSISTYLFRFSPSSIAGGGRGGGDK